MYFEFNSIISLFPHIVTDIVTIRRLFLAFVFFVSRILKVGIFPSGGDIFIYNLLNYHDVPTRLQYIFVVQRNTN